MYGRDGLRPARVRRRPELIRNSLNRRLIQMAHNVKLMQEAALVDPNRGTDLGPTKIYENLRLEISSLQCRESREKVVKEFIYSNPNICNVRDLHKRIGCFS